MFAFVHPLPTIHRRGPKIKGNWTAAGAGRDTRRSRGAVLFGAAGRFGGPRRAGGELRIHPERRSHGRRDVQLNIKYSHK